MTRVLARTLRAAAAVALAAALGSGAAHGAADPRKVVRDVFPVAETGFDPAAMHDLYSAGIVRAIFETLLTYDYLARPAKLVPQAAEAMPQVADDGRTWTVKVRRGIYFAADPAFGGRKRELTAADVVYSYKRLADPKLRSPWSFLVEGKFVGLDEEAAAAKKSGRFDYDRKVAGLEAVDRYTVRVRMKDTDYNLPYLMAHEAGALVAREVVEKYGETDGRAMSNPVGTGPYRLAEWVRSSKIVLEANPDYRGFTWDFAPQQQGDDKLVARMKGKRMPQVGRVEISIMEEDQARWLAFQGGELDLVNMEGPLAPNAIGADGRLAPALAAKGVRLDRFVEPEIRYVYWNMLDPDVGGLAKEKVALRRALAMSYDAGEEVRVVLNGQAVEAAYPIPPGVVGHDPAWKSAIRYDPAGANALLDRFGYWRGPDGWRTWPDGRPLAITYASRPDTQNRQLEELVKKGYDAIGVRMNPQKDKFPELLKLEKQCRLKSREAAWVADYPDGDNFMQLFYGPNAYQSNNACVSIPEYDALYRRTVRMPPGPARDALYREMARILEAYAPHRMTVSRYRNQLIQPRIDGYRKHPILPSQWEYLDVGANPN
ncbi:MAG: ABC transporter substrate-binding protein [Burkholderiales bacterium]